MDGIVIHNAITLHINIVYIYTYIYVKSGHRLKICKFGWYCYWRCYSITHKYNVYIYVYIYIWNVWWTLCAHGNCISQRKQKQIQSRARDSRNLRNSRELYYVCEVSISTCVYIIFCADTFVYVIDVHLHRNLVIVFPRALKSRNLHTDKQENYINKC